MPDDPRQDPSLPSPEATLRLLTPQPQAFLLDVVQRPQDTVRYIVRIREDAPRPELPGVHVARDLALHDESDPFAAIRAEAARRFLHVETDYAGLLALLDDPGVVSVTPEPLYRPTQEASP